MKEWFRKLLDSKIVMAVVSIVFGTVLIAERGAAVAFIVKLFGWVMVAAAVVQVIRYAVKRESREPGILASAVVCLIIGFIFVASPRVIVDLFPVLMGLVLIVSSAANIAGLLGSVFRNSFWTASLIFAIFSLVLGVVVLLHPSAVADLLLVIAGFTFVVNGFTDLMMLSAFRSQIKKKD